MYKMSDANLRAMLAGGTVGMPTFYRVLAHFLPLSHLCGTMSQSQTVDLLSDWLQGFFPSSGPCCCVLNY